MLENFIFSHQKTAFEEALNNNEVSNEAIVFIGDTKEIWNHGTYFPSGRSVEEIENIVASSKTVQDIMEQIAVDVINNSGKQDIIEDLDTIRSGAELGATALQPGNGDGTKYLSDNGEYKEIDIEQIVNKVLEIPSKYEFVDLGLPSGTKWATCNVGANSPEESGLYFAWGETEGYEGITDEKRFNWLDYKLCGGSSSTLTKYNTNSSFGTVDNKLVLEQVDDAAYQSDNTCRMPTRAELEELTANTTSTWETLNGVNGRRFTSKTNGNSIFVPAAGYCNYGSVDYVGSDGDLWSSSLYESSRYAWVLYFDSHNVDMINSARHNGYSVRAVQPADTPITINLKDLKDKTDLIETDGDGTKFLSDDGTYKEVSGGSEPYIWNGTTSETIFNELKAAIEDNKQIIFLNNNQYELICSYTEFGGSLVIGTKYHNYIVSTSQVMQIETNIASNNNHTSVSTESYFYDYNTLTGNLILTFNPNNLGGISEYNGEFTFGDTAYTVTFPEGITWITIPESYKPNTTYQFKILNNIGSVWEVGKGEVAYKSDLLELNALVTTQNAYDTMKTLGTLNSNVIYVIKG